MAISAKNGQILTIFGVKKIFDQKNLWWSSKSYGDTTSCKNLKKIWNSQGCRTGTHVRTHESEFIGSFRSLKTFEEPIRKTYSRIWKIQAKTSQFCQFLPKMAKFWPAKFWPSQNFPGIYTMIFSKKTTRVVSIPKL